MVCVRAGAIRVCGGGCACALAQLAADDLEGYTAFPSEGGHAEFAPRTPLEFEMLTYLMKKFKQQHRCVF